MKIKKHKIAAIKQFVDALIDENELVTAAFESSRTDPESAEDAVRETRMKADRLRRCANKLFENTSVDDASLDTYVESLHTITRESEILTAKYLDTLEQLVSVCSLDEDKLDVYELQAYKSLKTIKDAVINLTVAISDLVETGE